MTAPSHAVQVWVEGATIFLYFPGPKGRSGHTSTLQCNARGWEIVEEVLRERSANADAPHRLGVGFKSAPTTYRLEQMQRDWIATHGNPRVPEAVRELAKEIGEIEI